MSGTEDDEDLNRAIALSLGQNFPIPSGRDTQIVDLTSDDEDDDLGAFVSAKHVISTTPNFRDQNSKSIHIAEACLRPVVSTKDYPVVPEDFGSSSNANKNEPLMHRSTLASSAFCGLNRKKMEEERLLRISLGKRREEASLQRDESKKRKVSTSDSPLRSQDDRQMEPSLAELKAFPVKKAEVSNPIPSVTEYTGGSNLLNQCEACTGVANSKPRLLQKRNLEE